MGIPYGETVSAAVHGSSENEVVCESCSTVYCYDVERSGTADQVNLLWLDSAGAEARAHERAEQALKTALAKAVDPVACPECGWFQASMCRVLKLRRLYIALGIALPVALVLLVWGLLVRNGDPSRARILLLAGGGVAALGAVAGGFWFAVHDPNTQHPGPGGRNPELAQATRGLRKAEFEARNTQRVAEWSEKVQQCLVRSMLHMALADGSVSDREMLAVRIIYRHFASEEVSEAQWRARAKADRNEKATLIRDLQELAPLTPANLKGSIVGAAHTIADSDGEVDESEINFLCEIAQALGMTPNQLNQAIESTKQA